MLSLVRPLYHFGRPNRQEENMMRHTGFGSRTSIIGIHLLAWIVVCSLLAVGCGGSDGNSGTSSVTYSGPETPALITQDNANTLSASALETRTGATGFTEFASLDGTAEAVGESYQPFLTGVSTAIKGAMEQIDYNTASNQYQTAASQTDADLISGTCGGNASYAIEVDTDTGAFSGQVAFNDFCEEGVTIDGSATFSGVVNVNTYELESYRFSFSYLTAISQTESYTMDGLVDISISGSTVIVTMDMTLQDNNLDRICKVEGYQLLLTDGDGQIEIEVSGRFYDPDYGYVDLETEQSLIINEGDDYPSSGAVVLTGELGTAGGATKARLTALSASQCQVEADTDGDGVYDYQSEAISWSELDDSI
jgi:hypothetical protein